jgi:hypothetical protein
VSLVLVSPELVAVEEVQEFLRQPQVMEQPVVVMAVYVPVDPLLVAQ